MWSYLPRDGCWVCAVRSPERGPTFRKLVSGLRLCRRWRHTSVSLQPASLKFLQGVLLELVFFPVRDLRPASGQQERNAPRFPGRPLMTVFPGISPPAQPSVEGMSWLMGQRDSLHKTAFWCLHYLWHFADAFCRQDPDPMEKRILLYLCVGQTQHWAWLYTWLNTNVLNTLSFHPVRQMWLFSFYRGKEMDMGPRDACLGVPCRIQTRIPSLLVPGHWPFQHGILGTTTRGRKTLLLWGLDKSLECGILSKWRVNFGLIL